MLLSVFVLLLQVIACNSQNTGPVQHPGLSQAQVDSFRNLNGQIVPKSLWERIAEDSLPPTAVYFLVGNLDEDPAKELVLWYAGDMLGRAVWLDKKAEIWEVIGNVELSFFHGNNPPRIDSATKMLLTYHYGWGSGYGSEILNFYQNRQDSLVCVLSLLESEFVHVMGSTAYRTISTQYQSMNPNQILAEFRYQVIAGEDDKKAGKTIFEKRLAIPFNWTDSLNCFLPRLPKGFAQDANLRIIDEGESTFDPFFEKELYRLKWHGPRWKRRALGNPNEE